MFHPAGICLLKVNNRNTSTRCKICSKLTTKAAEISLEQISHLLVLLLLFEHVIGGCIDVWRDPIYVSPWKYLGLLTCYDETKKLKRGT